MKRIKPAVFAPYDLSVENYTSLLWLFEGFTSYYDDLMLVRSGLISQERLFRLLGKTIGGVQRGSGRLKQTVAESSFDAWVKYYRQDENAPNAIVSYYTKGSLVALAFDLTIRAQTGNRKSLDDVMRLLWQRYGRDFYRGKPVGVDESESRGDFRRSDRRGPGRSCSRDAVHGTRDLPLDTLLAPFGVTLAPDVATRQRQAVARRAHARRRGLHAGGGP